MPAFGQQAYVAVGGGVAVLGTGLSVTGYALSHGKQLWQTTLSAPDGTVIMSVRAWPGVITVGLLAPGGRARTEVVLNATTRRGAAALPGRGVRRRGHGIRGDDRHRRPRHRDQLQQRDRPRPLAAQDRPAGQSWQADGQTLYLARIPRRVPRARRP